MTREDQSTPTSWAIARDAGVGMRVLPTRLDGTPRGEFALIAAAAVFAVSGLLVCRVGSAITGASTVNYSVPLAGGGLGVVILDEHVGVAEFVALVMMLVH